MKSCPDSLDRAFGPRVDPCRRAFDFTQLFEECFLSIAPSILLSFAAFTRATVLQRARRRVAGTSMRMLKLVAIMCYGSVQLALLVLRCLDSTGSTLATIAATGLAVVDAVAMGILSASEHSRSIRPSAVLETYLFFTLLLDAACTRTAWLIGQDKTLSILTSTGTGIKLGLLVLETRRKSCLFPEDANRSPEEKSGAIGHALLWWLVGLINAGYRKILRLSELYPLTDEMRSEVIGARFEWTWTKFLIQPKSVLVRSLMQTFRGHLLAPVLPRLLLIALTYCQPLLVDHVLSLQKASPTESSRNIGYGLIGAYGIVYTGIAVSSASYWFRVNRATTLIRGAIASKVFSRVSELSIMDTDDTAAMTLMSTDVERITIGLNLMHETWANMIEVGVGISLLQIQLGLPALIALGVALACAVFAVALGSTAGRRQRTWMEAIERRISATSGMLASMKSVKMLGFSERLGAAIQKLRLEEIQSATNFRTLQIIMITLAYLPQAISPILTFAAYTAQPNESKLDVSRMFTSLSILTILAGQFTQLFQSIPALVGAFACLNRIQAFLLSDRHVDNRMRGSLLPAISTIDFSLGSMLTDLLAAPEPDFDSRIKKFATPLPSLNQEWDAIHLKEASFGWSKHGPPVLRNINASLPTSSLTMVIGPVGSGKSTLLKGILGEVYNPSGSVWISSRDAALCDQSPWLRNATVQQNIMGFKEWDRDWYSAVVRACALDDDLARLPHGDRTVVGSDGIALSGGQKQRVAIARAVYARKSIAVFDDVLSGLDNTTMNAVFHAVFGKDGLLRQTNTTVLLATHAVHVLQFADYVVALGCDGHIAEQGPFQELRSRHGSYVQRLCKTVEYVDDDDNDECGVPVNIRREKHALSSMASSRPETPHIDAPSRQLGDGKAYWYYFQATGLGSAAIFVVAELLFVALEYFPTAWLSWWADAEESESNDRGVAYYLGIYAALQVGFLFALFFGARHVAGTMVVRSGQWLHEKLVHTVMAAPLSFFSETDAGIILNRFSQDMHLIDSELPVSLLLLGAAALGSIAQAVVVLVAAHYVGAAFALVAVVFYFLQRYYLRTSRQLRYLDLEAKSPLYSMFRELLRGRATIRAFCWQSYMQDEFLRTLDASQRPLYLLCSIQQWLALVLGLTTAAVAVVLVAVMVTLRDSTTTAGLGGVALINMISLSSTLMSAVITWTKLETSIGAVARMKSFAAETPAEIAPREFEQPSENWPSHGAVEFRDVSISYKIDASPVVTDVSLSIKPGEKVAICGRSGSGKSTLISSLFRLVECTAGSIVIDGIDISTLPHELVRSRLNALPQEPYLAPGSIRFNADPLGQASDAAIITALAKVGLVDLIAGCPGGLNAHLEPDLLSHGQRQLFCLARAMVRKPRPSIFVVDEATSSVDLETDARIQRILREEFGGPQHTLLAVTHRVNTVLDFDRVAVFEEGRLIECDAPMALLDRRGGSAFRRLYMEFVSG